MDDSNQPKEYFPLLQLHSKGEYHCMPIINLV